MQRVADEPRLPRQPRDRGDLAVAGDAPARNAADDGVDALVAGDRQGSVSARFTPSTETRISSNAFASSLPAGNGFDCGSEAM